MAKDVTQIKKRDGRVMAFDAGKIKTAIFKALQATGHEDEHLAEKLTEQVVKNLNKKFDGQIIPNVEEIQDIIEEILIKEDLVETAKGYILYREQHAKIRDLNKFINSDDLIDQYLNKLDWRVKENSNMAYSLQGLNNHVASTISAHYWLNSIYPPEVRQAHIDADLHLHDLQLLAAYCCGWDIKDLLVYGFTGVEGKIQSKAPKHFRSALGIVVNFLYTLQGEANGAQALSNFDTYLAPFIRYDQLNYGQIKQALQEFMFNMNIPTRVGFQCMSEDTEILANDGWKKYNQVKKGDIIATFNIEKEYIEYLPVKKVFAKKYKGKMFSLKNKLTDQFISPKHRIVRKEDNKYLLEEIGKVIDSNSLIKIPIIQDTDNIEEIRDTYINKIEAVDYQGVIWCPNTDNETVIARRNGKIFITGNTPFTNITLDIKPLGALAEDYVIIGGEVTQDKYKDFQPEMDMFNRALAEVYLVGDAKGRVFTFPIPTYNITKDMDWENPVLDPVWEMTAKYGIPYFSNFINSDMNPDDARSMCCRLRLDNRELRRRGGGLFGANPLTGSIGVVTINLPRLGYLTKDKDDYFKRLDRLMTIARESLETKREVIEKFTEMGLYPYSKFYLGRIKDQFGEYWKNHFNTIGILGMNESMLNFIGKSITAKEGHSLAKEILEYMRDKLMTYQNETNHLYNLEATPGEGTTYRFAKADKKKYADIIVANERAYREKNAAPYYTNSSQLPVGFTDDIFEALDLQDDLQTKYTGGTVLHGFIGEKMPSIDATKNLVRKIAENYHLPYYTICPTFSICPIHGYLSGEHEYCPKCDEEIGYAEVAETLEANKAEQAELFSN